MKNTYIISIFTENLPGLLHRVTSVFTKRKVNIESITASQSEIEGIHRYTIEIIEERHIAEAIVGGLEKQIDIIKAFIHSRDEIVHQELAMYKIPAKTIASQKEVENIVREFNVRIITFEEDFVVLEKAGHESEIIEIYNKLKPYGLLEFVRSGKVAITKPMKSLHSFIKEMENNHDKQ